jgi:hypothetical protein
MNPLDDLETTLHGFRPRRPSRRLKAALFGTVPDSSPSPTPIQLWLAPLTAAAMLLLTMATAWSPIHDPGGDRYSLAALHALPTARAIAIDQNAPPTPRFRSTNAGAVVPRFGSLLLRQTNAFSR